MANSDDVRSAVANLRRFLRSRWEHKDERLFTTSAPVKRSGKPSISAVSTGTELGRPSPLPPPPTHQASSSARASPTTASAGDTDVHTSGVIDPASSEKGRALLDFYERIKDCQKCPLGKTRIKFVFGTGSPNARIFFVGEAPGEQEDKRGLPFIGPAGQLLTKLLAAIGISREDVFIGNVLKCRPPNNRTPQLEEIEECQPHLFEQIRIVKPKVVVALGAPAAQTLLKSTNTIGKLRGRWYKLLDADCFATYHPSAGLRAGEYKKVIEEDLRTLKTYLDKQS